MVLDSKGFKSSEDTISVSPTIPISVKAKYGETWLKNLLLTHLSSLIFPAWLIMKISSLHLQ